MKLKNLINHESKNVMFDKELQSGLHKFAKGRWDSSTPEERRRFLISAGIDSMSQAKDIRSKFDHLNPDLQNQIVFNITKDKI